MGQRGKIYLKKRLSAVIGEFAEKSGQAPLALLAAV